MLKPMRITVREKAEVRDLTQRQREKYLKLGDKLSEEFCEGFNLASSLDIDGDFPGMLAHVICSGKHFRGLVYSWPQGNYLICGGARQVINKSCKVRVKVYEQLVEHLELEALASNLSLFFREAPETLCDVLMDMGYVRVDDVEEVPQREGLLFLEDDALSGHDYILE
jgi:hypothetical protein